MCKNVTEVKEPRVKVVNAKMSGTHWSHHFVVEGVPRFLTWCPYGEKVVTMFRDLQKNEEFEFSGAQGEATKIVSRILNKEAGIKEEEEETF